jgi:lipoprotein-anchoring transpeptidase ErfK/SrfK
MHMAAHIQQRARRGAQVLAAPIEPGDALSRPFVRALAIALLAALLVLTMAVPAFANEPNASTDANGLITPVPGAPVRGVIPIEGIAAHPNFLKWQLDLLLDGDPNQAVFLGLGDQAVFAPTILAAWDTTLFPNGAHQLRLRVVRGDYNYDEYLTPVRISNASAEEGPIARDPVDPSAEPPAEEAPAPAPVPAAPEPLGANLPPGPKWIEVDLSDQMLTAWQGDNIVLQHLVSTGKEGWRTLPGTFAVYLKYEETRMKGGRGDDIYDTPDVPWTMYYSGGFAIHGAYWHNNFGTPVSHGCVNLPVAEAKALYEWAPTGTKVVVHQ